ncbi:MAG: hypothetical protein FWD44_09075 [Oscillospiraceae bacterium]|nr:hypothetical protein [Oscillospiraceae bacterium]
MKMDVFSNLYSDIKKAFTTISKRELKFTKRLRNIVVIVIVLFIVIPIGVNFLSNIELQQYGTIIRIASEVNIEESTTLIYEEYRRLENYLSSYNLPITSFKNSVLSGFREFLVLLARFENVNFDSLLTYVGFGFKSNVFLLVFLWNIIPLVILSLIISFFIPLSEKRKVGISDLVTILVLLVVVSIYSAAVAIFFAFLSFFVVYSIKLTNTFIVILSVLFLVFWLYKIIKYSIKVSNN